MSVPAATAAAGAAKRKQFSRNKKKNWKKFLDTKDIDVSNEERLKDELSGGSFSGKADAELFFVDKAPKANVAPVPKKKKEKKLLHCEKVLLPHPHTKAVSSRPDRVAKRLAGNRLVKKAAAVAAPAPALPRAKANAAFVATVDLWAASDSSSNGGQVVVPATMRQKPSAAVAVAAVKPAHPGQSYNPAYDDHVEAVAEAVQHIDKEQKMEQLWKDKLGTTVQQINSYATYAQEMALTPAAGDGNDDGDHDDDAASDSDAEVETDDAAQARNTRKTRAQRNQEMRRKEEERQREAAKLQRAREHELFRIKSLKRELAEEEQQHEQALAERGKRRAADTRPKKLSKYKFEAEPLEVQLTEDLAGSLRQLKPEGSLVKDRFRSLQERNAVEVRKKIKLQRRYKQKEYEKRSFKNNPWN